MAQTNQCCLASASAFHLYILHVLVLRHGIAAYVLASLQLSVFECGMHISRVAPILSATSGWVRSNYTQSCLPAAHNKAGRHVKYLQVHPTAPPRSLSQHRCLRSVPSAQLPAPMLLSSAAHGERTGEPRTAGMPPAAPAASISRSSLAFSLRSVSLMADTARRACKQGAGVAWAVVQGKVSVRVRIGAEHKSVLSAGFMPPHHASRCMSQHRCKWVASISDSLPCLPPQQLAWLSSICASSSALNARILASSDALAAASVFLHTWGREEKETGRDASSRRRGSSGSASSCVTAIPNGSKAVSQVVVACALHKHAASLSCC